MGMPVSFESFLFLNRERVVGRGKARIAIPSFQGRLGLIINGFWQSSSRLIPHLPILHRDT